MPTTTSATSCTTLAGWMKRCCNCSGRSNCSRGFPRPMAIAAWSCRTPGASTRRSKPTTPPSRTGKPTRRRTSGARPCGCCRAITAAAGRITKPACCTRAAMPMARCRTLRTGPGSRCAASRSCCPSPAAWATRSSSGASCRRSPRWAHGSVSWGWSGCSGCCEAVPGRCACCRSGLRARRSITAASCGACRACCVRDWTTSPMRCRTWPPTRMRRPGGRNGWARAISTSASAGRAIRTARSTPGVRSPWPRSRRWRACRACAWSACRRTSAWSSSIGSRPA